MNDINKTLVERGRHYGASFCVQCGVSQKIKSAMLTGINWKTMSDDKRESLDMIAVKISRILNGDADFYDSWHDIAGYAILVANTLQQIRGTDHA